MRPAAAMIRTKQKSVPGSFPGSTTTAPDCDVRPNTPSRSDSISRHQQFDRELPSLTAIATSPNERFDRDIPHLLMQPSEGPDAARGVEMGYVVDVVDMTDGLLAA